MNTRSFFITLIFQSLQHHYRLIAADVADFEVEGFECGVVGGDGDVPKATNGLAVAYSVAGLVYLHLQVAAPGGGFADTSSTIYSY